MISPTRRISLRCRRKSVSSGPGDAFLDHTDLIQTFVDENPADLTEEELAIVRSWRHLVAGKFFISSVNSKKRTRCSSRPDEQTIAYGVSWLFSQPPFRSRGLGASF